MQELWTRILSIVIAKKLRKSMKKLCLIRNILHHTRKIPHNSTLCNKTVFNNFDLVLITYSKIKKKCNYGRTVLFKTIRFNLHVTFLFSQFKMNTISNTNLKQKKCLNLNQILRMDYPQYGTKVLFWTYGRDTGTLI